MQKRSGSIAPIFKIIATAFIMQPAAAYAQISSHATYEEVLDKYKTFQRLDENSLGDVVNIQDGSLRFIQNDLNIKTNSGLTVSFGRTAGMNGPKIFGDWGLNAPYMSGTYSSTEGWNAGAMDGKRCSSGNFSPKRYTSSPGTTTAVPFFWHGIKIYIPDEGHEDLLAISGTPPTPNNGINYYGTTKSNWRVSCIPSTKNDGKEGFMVTLPDGKKYYFDWMSSQATPSVYGPVGQGQGLWVPRSRFFLHATKIEDIHGNTVTYEFSPSNPSQLEKIASSDGASIDISYGTNGKVSSAISNGLSWSYIYDNQNHLQRVISPDGSSWLFDIDAYSLEADLSAAMSSFWKCPSPIKLINEPFIPYPINTRSTISMTHPSGLIGRFDIELTYHGINNAPGSCIIYGPGSIGTQGVPHTYLTNSIVKKELSGPGLPPSIWEFSYQQSWSFSCSNCSKSSKVKILNPDLSESVHEYGNDYSTNYGQLLSSTIKKNGVTVNFLDISYIDSAIGQPFPDSAGEIPVRDGSALMYGNPFLYKNRPYISKKVQQDGYLFSTIINSFDAFVRPVNVTQSSTPSP